MENTKSVLKEVEKEIEIKVQKDFNPKDFFQDRKGLYVFEDFEDRILKEASSVAESYTFKVGSSELIERATDETIENSLPEKHIFTESEVCAVIADLISKQSKGEEGALLNNGYANLFYTKSFVVLVGWHDFGGEWSVHAWGRDAYHWDASHRVFSSAN